MVFFRQLFDSNSSTYTYILADEESKEAVIIDPVVDQLPRDLTLLKELGFKLLCELETHLHADHVCSGLEIRKTLPNVKTCISPKAGMKPFDELQTLVEGDVVNFGKYCLKVLETPGHTNGCLSYVFNDEMVFTGDACMSIYELCYFWNEFLSFIERICHVIF